ncbi:nucleoside-diphosphate sugar epimerase [Streptomyces avermitilis]|uniref:UDP-glucose 4-epimerase n=1 Tax=Streptomyces avermitilis TaxID=33903 RepID=A0A4D4MAC4_STRAX|nr:NAD-dependent epimerase/dehydratase family protein [Streptomyces avermitilis]OOV24718.1 nucleoside-diphosphate sugar epimerase [Streptomyces avermitilis]GDY68832.1 UDP-glucose 4-epimerase [Streptomyces avermitilis]GDY70785.1 UDP-glucose 4-epimerase [Streptomyces avermitilis]
MNIFVIGATGFVGAALARRLAESGHSVTGLARTDDAAATLDAQGITPVAGDLDARRPDVVEATLRADAVVYAAQAGPEQETGTVQDLTLALTGTGKTLIFLSGSGVLMQRTAGAWSPDVFAEYDPFVPEPLADFRKAAEDTVLAAAEDGVRAMVIRPGLIWGPGDHGHMSMIYQSVAASGAACYVGQGLNTYSHVHIDDVTRLFTLALERGRPGGLYHVVAGETPNRWIAERVADDLGVQARSVTAEEAQGVWGEFGALIMAASSRIRASNARQELGWNPEHTDMLTMIGQERLRKLATPSV